jgi:hypothetical protein
LVEDPLRRAPRLVLAIVVESKALNGERNLESDRSEIETTGHRGERRRFRVRGLLLNRAEYPTGRLELGVPDSFEAYVVAALYSFTAYVERRLRELRGEGRW